MANLFQDVDLLHDFLFRVDILHVTFVDGFNGNLATSQLVNGKCYLPKCAFANKFDKLVEVLRRWRQLSILLEIKFVVLD